MFCQKCGASLGDTVAACINCNTPVLQAPAGAASSALAGTVKSTSKDAAAAFKSLAGNPVGGLQPAFEALGEAKAMRTGVAFGIFSLACFLLGGYLLLPRFLREDVFEFLEFQGVVKALMFAAVPFVGLAAGSLAVRKVFGGQGKLAGDCFIAGAALLPASVGMVLGGIVGLENYQMIAVLTVFALCIGVLMLFAGYTRISRLSDRAAAIGVPVVVTVTVWLAKVLGNSVMSGSAGGPGDFNF